MTTLHDLFLAVKENNLSKDQLEGLHKEMSEVKADKLLQLADVEKKKAVFMLQDPEKTGIAKKRAWDGSPDGLIEIDLKAQIRAITTHLKSLQSRLYSNY